MKNIFRVLILLIAVFALADPAVTMAQDTVKKTVVKKPSVTKTNTTIVMPPGTKPAAIDPKTGKPVIPINPKTGRPYTHYGYGAFAANHYDAKAAQKADSIKKASALKANAPATTAIPAPNTRATTDSTAAPAPVDKSLNGQYQYLLNKVYYNQKPLVAAFWKIVSDSLKANKQQLTDAQTKAATQNKTINGLQADSAANSNTDDTTLLGMSMSKTTYSLIMWTLVIVFAAIAVIVIARSGSLKSEAAHRTSLYADLEDEFKNYKTKANDREKKLARELQTERNKVDELMGRG